MPCLAGWDFVAKIHRRYGLEGLLKLIGYEQGKTFGYFAMKI